ncbi:MAG TPA: hypothetical protein PK523_11085 [Elusimicrobiales bacterium]|nr:hypothetical protein [Elusimicrobiales bacterium]
MSVIIRKGSILVHRVYDVAGEIDLAAAEKLLSAGTASSRFSLRTDTRRAIIIKEAPLQVPLGRETLAVNGGLEAEMNAKLWDYGVISVTLELPMPAGIRWEELVALADALEESDEPDALALKHRDALKSRVGTALKQASDWGIAEDYITYIINEAEGVPGPLDLLEKADVPSLLLAENRERLSRNSADFIMENVLQYGEGDLAVIDWNSALLVEPRDQRDVADVIEFSLSHLLEFRYYDDKLSAKLDLLYDTIEGKRESPWNFFRNFYADIAEEASRQYIEFSEFLERIENSLKTVGDPYLATVFRASAHQFRFDDWRKNISRKMDNLAQITQMLQIEVNSRRGHLLETIIILLIAIEIIPVFYDAFR